MDYNAYRTYRQRHDEHLWQECCQEIETWKDRNPDDPRADLNIEWYIHRVAVYPGNEKFRADLRIVLDRTSIALNFMCFSYLERFFDDLSLSDFLAWGRDNNA